MLTKAEILARLGNWLSPGDLSEVIRKLLRVPEAWDQLHDPEFLDAVLDENAEQTLLPANLLRRTANSQNLVGSKPVEETFEAQLENLRKECERRSIAGTDLEDVAYLTSGLQQVINSPIHPEVLDELLVNFDRWLSPLACAWPTLENGNELLQSLILQDWDPASFLALNTILANHSHEQAVPILLDVTKKIPRYKVFLTLSAREPKLLEVIAQNPENLESSHLPEDSPDSQLSLAILAQLNGYAQLAMDALDHADELITELAAHLQDQKASISQSLSMPEMALEARQHATAIQNSPERIANLAILLIREGKFTEAMEILPSEPQSLPEKIAVITALIDAGEKDRVKSHLQSAVHEAYLNPFEDPIWISRLIDLLRSEDELPSAIKVATARVKKYPEDTDALTDLADLLNQGGDPKNASEFASLAFALSPQSTLNRQILAISLQESGNPVEALAHWQALADENPLALSHVAQCALEAGFVDLAKDVAQSFLDQDPQSALGMILMGKVLAANGELEDALGILEKATQEFPDDPGVWMALAECQDQAQDKEAAGRTLATAIQLIPDHAELLYVYADWLENQGRHTEAVEFAERAYQAEPKGYEHQLKYGSLLKDLGRLDDALPILEQAVAQKPFLWKGMLTLAKTFEGLGNPILASRSLKNLPDTAPAEAHVYAAKISVKAAYQQEDHNFTRIAKYHLDQARSKGSSDDLLPFIQGQIHEMEGNSQAALECYETSAKNFIQKDPELYLQTKLGIARAALVSDQIQLATASLEEARFRYPNSIDVLLTLSQTYLQSGDELEALKTIERALKIEPANRYALKQIARIASQLNTWAPAMHALRKSVDLTPHDPDAWIDFAENALIVGNSTESRNALSEALRLNRKDPQILANSAKIMHQMKEHRSARRLLKRALNLNPDSAQLLKQLALVAEETGDFETAIEAWERVTHLDPDDKQSLSKTAQAHWAASQHSSAIDLWHQVLKLDPSDTSTLEVLANAYIAQGDGDAGLSLFYKAISQNPENVDIALKAAQLAMDIGATKEAFDILTDVIRYAPKRTDVLLTTAECLVRRNLPDKALEVLDTVIVEDTFPALWFAIAAIASTMSGDASRAHSSFEQGHRHSNIDNRSRALLSRTALRLNRWSDALDILSSFDEDDVSHERALMEAHIRIRAMEVKQLYSEADVVSHGPPDSLTESENLANIQELLLTASTSPMQKARVDQLMFRAKLLSDQEDIDLLLQDRSHMEKDRSGETLEAMALARLRADLNSEALELIALRDDFNLEGDYFDFITGLCQKKLDRPTLAREAFRAAQEKPLYQPMGQYLEGILLLEEGRIEDAKRLLNTALTAWPDEPTWQYRLGQQYLEEKALDSALPHLQEAAELAPTNEIYNLSLARVLRDTGHLTHAFARFSLAVKNNPSDAHIWSEAGSMALATGNPEMAEKYFERACTLSPSDASYLVGAARASLALGNSKVAMEKVRAALRITPDDPETLIAAGEIFSHEGRFDKAISSYDLALSKASDPIPVHLARTKLLIQAGRFTEAVDQTSELIQGNLESEKIWEAHAEACEAAGDLVQAQEAAAMAVRLAPNNPNFRLILGRLARKSGQLDRALDELSRLEQSDPTNPKVLLELGQLYEDRRQYNAALDTYQRALSIDSQCVKAYFRAGLVLKQLKSYADAAAMLNKAVELEPNNPDSHHQLAAVRALELVHGGIPQMVVST
jgi:tetratricopeptide (TPR) repeat protein